MVRVSVVFSGGIDILRVSECHLLQSISSQRLLQKLHQVKVSYNSHPSFWYGYVFN